MAQDLVAVSDNNVLSGIIDPDNQEYSFEYGININGVIKKGVFKCRYPSVADRIKIGVMKAKALDGIDEEKVDMATRNLVFVLSFLRTLLIKTPSWFELDKLTEIDEIMGLYGVVDNYITRFHGEFLTPKFVTDSENAPSEKNMASSENIENATDRPAVTSSE